MLNHGWWFGSNTVWFGLIRKIVNMEPDPDDYELLIEDDAWVDIGLKRKRLR